MLLCPVEKLSFCLSLEGMGREGKDPGAERGTALLKTTCLCLAGVSPVFCISLAEVESVRAVWAEGRREEDQKCPEFGSVCMSHGWQGVSPPGHFKRACGMPRPGMAALRVRESAGGLGWGWKGWHGREEEGIANEQQRRTQVKLDVG